jgi:hypothetical protein
MVEPFALPPAAFRVRSRERRLGHRPCAGSGGTTPLATSSTAAVRVLAARVVVRAEERMDAPPTTTLRYAGYYSWIAVAWTARDVVMSQVGLAVPARRP